MTLFNNNKNRAWSYFIAYSLTNDEKLAKQAEIAAMSKMEKLDEHNLITAGIITKRLLKIDTKQLWTYLKPNFDLPDMDNISETEATMHCLSGDELDVLLLCEGLGYSFGRVEALLGLRNIEVWYKQALFHLENLITFQDDATDEVQKNIVSTILQDMCKEIRKFAAKNTDKTDGFRFQLKKQVVISVIVFAIIDIIAISSLALIFAIANNFNKKQNMENISSLENTVNNVEDGLYYELNYIPDGYYRFSHSISPLIARSEYGSSDGGQILFTQQVSDKKISGFSQIAKDYSIIAINNHSAALHTDGARTTIYWYNDCYAYSLSGTTKMDELLKTAKGIKYIPPQLPADYSQYLAHENGDIEVGNLTSADKEKINAFYKSYTNKERNRLRLYEASKGGVVIKTFETENGRIYYTKDARRSDFGEQEFENGVSFDQMTIETDKMGNSSLILKSELLNNQFTAIKF